MTARERVVVAGAAGFIGRAALRELAPRFAITALTQRLAPALPAASDAVTWRTCDLFSQRQLEEALEGAVYAVYLVHSRLPSASLVQGLAADREIILASNFARCAERAGVRQIVHVVEFAAPGQPSGTDVEETFRSHSVPVTTLRTPLVLGVGGATHRILDRLARVRPVLPLPAWADRSLRPIDVEDLARLLVACVGEPACFGRSTELAGPEVVTFRQLVQLTARERGAPGRTLRLPGTWRRLSAFAIGRLARVPVARAEGLVEILSHAKPGLPASGDRWLQAQENAPGRPLAQTVAALALDDLQGPEAVSHDRPTRDAPAPARHEREVRSVQRLPLPGGWDARQVAREYVHWLPGFLFPLLRADVNAAGHVSLSVLGLWRPILELTFSAARSTGDRQLFYITGGLLARHPEGRSPRLEFRVVLRGRGALAAVHDFAPRLPWGFYRLTQAVFHAFVMRAFGRHLARLLSGDGARHAPMPPLNSATDEVKEGERS